MQQPSREDIIQALLYARPLSAAHTLGIPIEDGSSESLFRLLTLSLLYKGSASIQILARVSQIFIARNWNIPRNLRESTGEERLKSLQDADYVVFDQGVEYAKKLGSMAQQLQSRYNDDLNALRSQAREDPALERGLLMEFDGMEHDQANFFLREAQVAWCEHFPFMAEQAMKGAVILGLPEDPVQLSQMTGALQFPRLVAALDQVGRTGNGDEILQKAGLAEVGR